MLSKFKNRLKYSYYKKIYLISDLTYQKHSKQSQKNFCGRPFRKVQYGQKIRNKVFKQWTKIFFLLSSTAPIISEYVSYNSIACTRFWKHIWAYMYTTKHTVTVVGQAYNETGCEMNFITSRQYMLGSNDLVKKGQSCLADFMTSTNLAAQNSHAVGL